jgi:hypothetical protein
MHSFSELFIGDVFVAPFSSHAVTAIAIFFAFRPILHLCRFDKLFNRPAATELPFHTGRER